MNTDLTEQTDTAERPVVIDFYTVPSYLYCTIPDTKI